MYNIFLKKLIARGCADSDFDHFDNEVQWSNERRTRWWLDWI